MSGFGLLAFIASVAFWPGIPDMATVPRWAIIAIGLPLVSRLDIRAIDQPFRDLLLIGLAWAAVTVIWTPDHLGGALALFYLAVLALVFIAAAEAFFDDLMFGLALGVAVSAVFVVVQLAGWSPVTQFSAPAGLFFNRDLLAEFVAPVWVWVAMREGSRSIRIAASVVIAMILMATHCRSAGLAAALGFIYASRLSFSQKSLAVAGIAVLGVAALAFGDQATAQQRIAIWWQALTHISVFGHGIGWFQVSFPLYASAHNDLLQLFAELGIGAIPWLLIPVLIFANGRGGIVQRAVLLTICVEAAVSFPLHTPMGGFVGAAVSGCLAGNRGRVFSRRTLVAV